AQRRILRRGGVYSRSANPYPRRLAVGPRRAGMNPARKGSVLVGRGSRPAGEGQPEPGRLANALATVEFERLKANPMETEKDPLKPVAQTLVETYNTIQKRRRPMVEELAGASGTRRAMVVAAIEFGRTAEECCHIALKAAGFNPAFCQVQTLN